MKLFVYCVVFLVLFLDNKTSYSQGDSIHKFSVAAQPMQILFGEIPVSLSRNYLRHSFGLQLAYRIGGLSLDNAVGYYIGYKNRYLTAMSKAATIGLSSRYYTSSKRRGYWEAQIFFRRWWFRNKFYEAGHPKDRYRNISSLDMEVWGAKILYGKTVYYKTKNRNDFFVNCYIGLGFRRYWSIEKGLKSEFYNGSGSWSRYFEFSEFNGDKILVSPQLGFSVGFDFRKPKIKK